MWCCSEHSVGPDILHASMPKFSSAGRLTRRGQSKAAQIKWKDFHVTCLRRDRGAPPLMNLPARSPSWKRFSTVVSGAALPPPSTLSYLLRPRSRVKTAQQGDACRQSTPEPSSCTETGGVPAIRQAHRSARLADCLNAMAVAPPDQRCPA